MEHETSSEALYADCGREGSDAQADAFRQLWEQLYRLAYAMLHTRADAESLAADCAQSALIKVHRNLAQCREPTAFRGWAAQIVRRAVIDMLRQPAVARRAPLPGGDGPCGRGQEHAAAGAARPAARPGGALRWNRAPIDDPSSVLVQPRSAYVPQVPRLFSDSLRDNVLMGLPTSGEQLEAALRAAVLTPDLAALDHGLDTLIGPRGVRLSGGHAPGHGHSPCPGACPRAARRGRSLKCAGR